MKPFLFTIVPIYPRLRSASKVQELYPLNRFPAAFVHKLAGLITAHWAVVGDRLEGEQWEEIFALCIGADWVPSNIGLDDVRHNESSTAWGAKTVKKQVPATLRRRTSERSVVRLISGRNSVAFSFGTDIQVLITPPEEIGKEVLAIWNARVADVRRSFSSLRTVVLLKDFENHRFSVFEHDTELFDYSQYRWSWNPKKNIVGHDEDGVLRFTWQPHGSQFTIHADVPDSALRVQLSPPPQISREAVLAQIGFSERSYSIL